MLVETVPNPLVGKSSIAVMETFDTGISYDSVIEIINCLCMHALCESCKPHPSQREEESGYAATIELSPRQKLDVTNQIRGLLECICCHGVQLRHTTSLADVSILLPNRYVR